MITVCVSGKIVGRFVGLWDAAYWAAKHDEAVIVGDAWDGSIIRWHRHTGPEVHAFGGAKLNSEMKLIDRYLRERFAVDHKFPGYAR